MLARISDVPKKPGIYIFKDHKDKILYVGKAKNLKNRLKSYFQKTESLDPRKSHMVKLSSNFAYIITENELEALILEANLIKQHKPRFNVVLRDDKNYPYLKLTMNEQWPRIEVVRKIVKDGSLYFGPYVPAQGMWDILSFIRRNFPIRICKHSLDNPMRPCIQYQMGRCPAPCGGRIEKEDYMKIVNEVRLFLSGKKKELLAGLEKKMAVLSDDLKFEEAAAIRNRINNLRRVWESQKVFAPELGDIDIIGFYSERIDAVFEVFFIRNGILSGAKDFYLKDVGNLSRGELFRSFIESFYAKEIAPSTEVVVGGKPDDLKNLNAWLRNKRGGKVEIKIPGKGRRLELLRMADENAEQIFKNRRITGPDDVLSALRDHLRLPHLPASIGAFDISTTAGSESVGAFICWSHGEFDRERYRHLKIKGVSGIDDYSMMSEAVTRVLLNLGDKIPDLIIVDGGKGQLEVARAAVEKNKITCSDGKQPMLIAVAKDPDRAFTLSSDVINLEDKSPASFILKKIRDEVHRFALSYHRKLRGKKVMESPLEKVRGIGTKRRLELLRHFGSIEAIKNASIEEVAGLKGFNKQVAENLLNDLRRQ